MIRIVVVEPSGRGAIASALARIPTYDIVATATSAADAVTAATDREPDIALLDLELDARRGGGGGWLFREHFPRIRTIAITRRTSDGSLIRAFSGGAHGIVLARPTPMLLYHAITVVTDGGTFIDPGLGDRLVKLAMKGQRSNGPFGLTGQELRVLERLSSGMSNRELAIDLGIAENTVKSHVRVIMRKLDTSDRAEVATIAVRCGLA